jgi:hypothetical protein
VIAEHFARRWQKAGLIDDDLARRIAAWEIANRRPVVLWVLLFVPEDRAAGLEILLTERPRALTVDLAVRPDGSAAIKALRVDGERLGL